MANEALTSLDTLNCARQPRQAWSSYYTLRPAGETPAVPIELPDHRECPRHFPLQVPAMAESAVTLLHKKTAGQCPAVFHSDPVRLQPDLVCA